MILKKSELEELYPSVLNYKDIFYKKYETNREFFKDYLTSKLWRLNNLYTIIDKNANRIKFVMNRAQHKVYSISLKKSRLVILKSRQQGISTLWLVSFFDDCMFHNNMNSGLMAQGLEESQILLKRIKVLWDNLHPRVKKYLGIKIRKDNKRNFEFSNGSSIFVQTSFRSTTLHRLHISEYGKIASENPKRALETKTGTLQAISPSNTTIIESTAEGENDFKGIWDKSYGKSIESLAAKQFYGVFLSWVFDKDCYEEKDIEISKENERYFLSIEKELNVTLTRKQKNFWLAQKEELGSFIYQEYPAFPREAFLKDKQGTYYAELYTEFVRLQNREIKNLYNNQLPVQVAIDLGMNDLFVLIFFQHFRDGWRIIDEYYNSGKGIEHYCEVMKDKEINLGYNITNVILPHDANVEELNTNMSREQAFWKFGYGQDKTFVVEKPLNLNNDIENVRQKINRIYIDPEKASYIVSCFLEYSREWDDKHMIWRNKPRHDKYSHGADAVRLIFKGYSDYNYKPTKLKSKSLSI